MMLQTILALVVIVTMAHAGKQVCQIRRGKVMRTFSNTKERILFPCKYPVLRQTQCGDWMITLTPGNVLESENNKRYIIKTVWMELMNMKTGDNWEGRSDLQVAQKYLDEKKDVPFNKKAGTLELSDIFKISPPGDEDEVVLDHLNKQFKIIFGVYQPYGRWHRASYIYFQCTGDFVPTNSSRQLCGDGTKNELKLLKKEDPNLKQLSRPEIMMYHVFSNPEVVQPPGHCSAIAKTIINTCTAEQRYVAARRCAPLVSKKRFRNCVLRNLEDPLSALRNCVDFVCSGETNMDSCNLLGQQLDKCQELPEISLAVKEKCATDLAIKS